MSDDRSILEAAFERACPAAEWRDVHVVVAVSGGADSVAMLRAAAAIKERAGGKGRLFAAHLNHRLRGRDGDADVDWVRDLCQRLNVPLEVGHADVANAAAEVGDGLEAAARAARYEFLRETAERLGARFVAIAHTADDQVETIVHRLVRGTGLTGLSGIPASRPLSATVSLVRPLLGMRRAEVLRYLAAWPQDFRDDATNADRRFTRNRIRHELLPLVRSNFNPDFDEAVLRLCRQAAEAQQVIAEAAARLANQAIAIERVDDVVRPARSLRICRSQLSGESPLLIREACKIAWTASGWPLQDMGYDQWQQLAAMIKCGTRSEIAMFPGGIRAEVRGDALLLESTQR